LKNPYSLQRIYPNKQQQLFLAYNTTSHNNQQGENTPISNDNTHQTQESSKRTDIVHGMFQRQVPVNSGQIGISQTNADFVASLKNSNEKVAGPTSSRL
jgi:hypothetical protein